MLNGQDAACQLNSFFDVPNAGCLVSILPVADGFLCVSHRCHVGLQHCAVNGPSTSVGRPGGRLGL